MKSSDIVNTTIQRTVKRMRRYRKPEDSGIYESSVASSSMMPLLSSRLRAEFPQLHSRNLCLGERISMNLIDYFPKKKHEQSFSGCIKSGCI